MKSWDRSQIPKPFARVGLAFAPPIVVPREADGAALDGWRERLETALADCERRSAALVNR